MSATINPYYPDYPGVWRMQSHDGRTELRRWFDNWALDKNAYFSDTEWLTIGERSWTHRGKKIVAYDGVIGADHHDRTRKVCFEPGAPPPPTFFMPVKTKYEPPVPEPAWVTQRRHQDFLRAEAEWRREMWRSFTPQQRFIVNVLPPMTPPPPRYRRNA